MTTLWVALAHAWTCVEATHLFASGPPLDVEQRLRDGWRYTPDELRCLVEGGVPVQVIGQHLREQRGHPVDLSYSGKVATAVIDFACGTLRVEAGPEVRVTGFDENVDPLTFTVGSDMWSLELADRPRCADLRVQLPPTARLVIASKGTHVHVSGIAAPVEIEAAQADIVVEGPTPLTEIKALRGDVLVDVSGDVDVEAGEGQVYVGAGAGGTIRVNTVSGDQWLWGGPLRRVIAESVTGDVRIRASYQPASTVSAWSHEGDVVVGLPAAASVVFSGGAVPKRTGPDLLQGPHVGSMRPGRTTPDGSTALGPCFDCMPGEIRGIWGVDAPTRLWLGQGARVVATHSPPAADVRLAARSFSGQVRVVTLDGPVPSASGAVLSELDALLPTLERCQPGLSTAVPWLQVDAWATLRFEGGRVVDARLTASGDAPSLEQCVTRTLSTWATSSAVDLTLDLPLRLAPVRAP